jgi:hypothetical protein
LLAFVCTTFRPYPSIILEKELTEIFALCSGAGHPTQQGGAIKAYQIDLKIYDTEFISNVASLVRG